MNDKLLNGATIFLFFLGVGCIIYVLFDSYSQESEFDKLGNVSCVKSTDIIVSNDATMAGLIELNARVKVYRGYYGCNMVERGDMVLFQFSKSIPPVVRIIYGLPGDKFKLTKNAADQWRIDINGTVVSGSAGEYTIASNSIPPLKTYEISRRGVLKENEYILFADQSPAISDSSNLGIITKDKIVGKALLHIEDAG